jgi:hypothetical protein
MCSIVQIPFSKHCSLHLRLFPEACTAENTRKKTPKIRRLPGGQMKRSARIDLYSPGIVVFDPAVLDRFLIDHAVSEPDVFSRFLEDEALGRDAVAHGAVCPIYQIPENEYSVFIVDAENQIDIAPEFSHAGFPLRIESGILVVSDLSALLDWDRDFFTDYRRNYADKLASNDYLDAPNGLYSVTINGYVGLQAPYAGLAYGLVLHKVPALPGLAPDASVDDRSYVLSGAD